LICEAQPPDAPNNPPLADGIGTETYIIELRERLNLSWQSGRFQVNSIFDDQMPAARNTALKGWRNSNRRQGRTFKRRPTQLVCHY
jgi:hypothetical protein